MVNGVPGRCGHPVQSHVEKENKRVSVPAPIHHQPMVDNSALVRLSRHRNVTLNLAQVCNGS